MNYSTSDDIDIILYDFLQSEAAEIDFDLMFHGDPLLAQQYSLAEAEGPNIVDVSKLFDIRIPRNVK